MSRVFLGAVLLVAWTAMAAAQSLTGLARVEAAGSAIEDGWWGGSEITLRLSRGVPFRVFTLDGPPRLVVDFSEVDFSGVAPEALLPAPGAITELRFGTLRPGWSRMVADLAGPMLPERVGMAVEGDAGDAVLRIALEAVPAAEFAAAAGAPEGETWLPDPAPAEPERAPPGVFTVVLDPGHGGIDPGAEHDGLVEKEIVLDVARQLRDRLRREGLRVVMTRDADVFVSLEGRTAIAHQAGGALFLSIHADALSQGGAAGATVYTLSEEASDTASALLAARHDRSDILAGIDLTGADDEVTSVLLDIARRETEPRSIALAEAVIASLAEAGGPMNSTPRRQAGFSVLKSADIPSVLVEIGFLSSRRDRANLADPEWRARMAGALAQAVLRWRDADAFRAQLVRQ